MTLKLSNLLILRIKYVLENHVYLLVGKIKQSEQIELKKNPSIAIVIKRPFCCT